MNLNKYCLKNGLVYYQEKLQPLDILIEDGIVIEIGNINYEGTIIDCHNKLVTPGFIDGHVHFRTPGFSHKEDLHSGSMAALKGGFSHVCTMPNTSPCLDDVQSISEHIKEINSTAKCHVYPFSAVSENLAGKNIVAIEENASLNIAGFSDDGKGIQNNDLMKEALIRAGACHKLVSAHCEDEEEFKYGMSSIGLGVTSATNNMLAISNKSEYAMIERDIALIKEIHGKKPYQYHVCHVSTKESLNIIKEAQQKGYHVSCEATPHHLISDESSVDVNDANYKMNPPLRSREDVNALVAGLNDGSIEVIATDHAPHTIEEKSVAFEHAPFGIIGLELAFSLLNTYLVSEGKVKLETILKCLIDNPRRIFKIDNSLKVGNIVYLNIIDLNRKHTYTKDNLQSKSSNTFYLNVELTGLIEMSIFEKNQYQWV